MPLWERSRILSVLALASLLTLGATAPALADEVEQVKNGGFDGTTDPFWSTAGMPMTLTNGQACVDVPGGTTNRWDVAIGQNDVPLVAGQSYRFSFDAAGTAGHVVRAIVGLAVSPYDTYFEQSPVLGDLTHYSYTFTASTDTAQGQVAFRSAAAPTRGTSASTTCRWSGACRPRCTCRTPARASGSTRSRTCRRDPRPRPS